MKKALVGLVAGSLVAALGMMPATSFGNSLTFKKLTLPKKECRIDVVADDRFIHKWFWSTPDWDVLFVFGHNFYGKDKTWLGWFTRVEATLGILPLFGEAETTGWVFPNGVFLSAFGGEGLKVNSQKGILQNLWVGQEFHHNGKEFIVSECDTGLQPISGILDSNIGLLISGATQSVDDTTEMDCLSVLKALSDKNGTPIGFDADGNEVDPASLCAE
jgi:hypothetical protein